MHYASAALLFALIAVILSACGGKADSPDDPELDPDFLTPVAEAQEAGVTVYWLGPSFEVDGVIFGAREAEFPRGILGVALDGLQVRYSTGRQPGGFLYLDVIGRSDWMKVEDKVANLTTGGDPTPARREKVLVGDTSADLLFLPLGTRPINQLWLIVDLGETVVVAITLSGGPVYPGGPDSNPFINNPDLLVALMDDLRPYPE